MNMNKSLAQLTSHLSTFDPNQWSSAPAVHAVTCPFAGDGQEESTKVSQDLSYPPACSGRLPTAWRCIEGINPLVHKWLFSNFGNDPPISLQGSFSIPFIKLPACQLDLI